MITAAHRPPRSAAAYLLGYGLSARGDEGDIVRDEYQYYRPLTSSAEFWGEELHDRNRTREEYSTYQRARKSMGNVGKMIGGLLKLRCSWFGIDVYTMIQCFSTYKTFSPVGASKSLC
jgi:hypothetical protein